MVKISRNTDTVAQSAQDRPILTTEAKEIYCLEDETNLSRDLVDQDEDDELAEEDDEVSHDEVSRGNHLIVHERQASTANYHHQQLHNYNHDGRDHDHDRHHYHQKHHAPTCKLVNTELPVGPEPARYQHRPHCLHHDHHCLHSHLHKPNCAVHNSNQPLGSNQKLFKNLIAQQHVQLSAATTKPAHGGVESSGRLHAVYRPASSQHQTRYVKASPPAADQKSKYLLVEYQRPSNGGGSNLAPSLSVSGESNIRHRDDQPTHVRHHSRHMTTNVDGGHTRQTGTHGAEKRRQKHAKTTTTLNFIAQLYFLIHLSAMISLLLHHKNLVSNESRAGDLAQHHIQQQQQTTMQTMQQLSQQEQQQQQHIYAATTRRSSQIAPPGVTGVPAHTAAYPDRNNDMHHRRGHMQRPNASDSLPSLPVPQMQQVRGVHQINGLHHHDELIGANDASPNGRLVRSIFGPDPSSHSLDARSPDILVRLVGRTHAKLALQYFLCYLLSSSITILVFLWLVRVCTATRPSRYDRRAKGAEPQRRSGRLIETRQDCTPVLIGSISLGLIQLIVIGLDIADNIDWLTTSPSSGGSHSPLGLTANYAERTRANSDQWPIFVPMLQFVFVSLLMQYILAKVARIRGLMGLTEDDEAGEEDEDETEEEEDDDDDDESERRVQRLRKSGGGGRPRHRGRQVGAERSETKSLSDNLQNIALAHLLVTHILLWLMKLNSISLFHTSGHLDQHHQQVFVPFVMSPLPLPLPPPLTTGGGSTTLPPATTSSAAQPQPRRTTTAPAHLGAASSSSAVPELQHQGEQNNGQTATTTTTTTTTEMPMDERPRREKVLSSLRNANSFANNHLTGGQAKQPQLVIVATRAADYSSGANGGHPGSTTTTSSTTTTTTTGRPSELTTLRAITGGARAPNGESDAHDRDELKLVSLVPPPPLSSSTTTRVPQGLPQSITRASDQATTATPLNSTKSERDLYANVRRRPLAPETIDEANDDRLEPIQVVSERPVWSGPAGEQRVSLAPLTTSPVQTKTTSHQAKRVVGVQQTLAELRPANLSASLFKSSLPKRMTAFRQGRPSQRVNLVSSSSSSTTTTGRPASTSKAPPNGSITPTALDSDKKFLLKSSQAGGEQPDTDQEERPSRGGERHRVRVTVAREQSFPQTIDLTAVIPAPGGGNRTSEKEEDDDDDGSENEISNSPPSAPFRTTDRPFPSVDDDPAPSTATTKSQPKSTTSTNDKLDQEREREPNESVAVANQTRVVAPPTSSRRPPPTKTGATGLPRPVTTTTMPVPSTGSGGGDQDDQVEDEEDSTSDEGEVDLDALLPPVPNYGNETSDATSGGEDSQTDEEALKLLVSETPARRRARKLGPSNSTRSLNLLDEAAFVFNEAASSRVENVTVERAILLLNRAEPDRSKLAASSIAPNSTKISNKTQSLDSMSKEALTMQQQANQHNQQTKSQQQPTFGDFLLPIVQQYHILVLTILFNMWLDSMQRLRRRPKQTPGESIKHSGRKQPKSVTTTMMMMVKRDQSQAASRRRSTPKRHILDRSSPSSRDLSPVRSSGASSSSPALANRRRSLSQADLLAHVADSSSLSRGSSTKRLVSAIELARHDARRARQRPIECQQVARRRHAVAMMAPRRQRSRAQSELHAGTEISSSVCSVFFGLLVVSGSLIVILLGVDLLSLLVQCAIQLISIAICLLGLCIVWRIKTSARTASHLEARKWLRSRGRADQSKASRFSSSSRGIEIEIGQQRVGHEQEAISHKSSFHYLFLLAAYYCGISVALNLGQQHQIQRLFPVPVVQFLQRLFATSRQMDFSPFAEVDAAPFNHNSLGQTTTTTTMTTILNLQLLFYCALTLKGLALIVQVTLQTILIRSSWRWSGARAELRQIYTFLMFTNLSLWALEICDQQQQMLLVKHQHQHQHQVAMQQSQQQHVASLQHLMPQPASSHNFELLTLEGFTRFAGSVVTLSHLYHGLVFMQH